MKLGVDLIFVTGTKGGMETYVRELYRRLPDHLPGAELVGYASRQLASEGASWFPGALVDTGIDGDDRAAWARGTMVGVGRRAMRDRVDLLHAPANFGPIGWAPPTVLTVHDLIAHRHPEYVPSSYAPIIRGMVRLASRRAARILTPSDATAADLRSLLGVPGTRIDVTPLASTIPPTATGAPAERQVLIVGNRMPHKNVNVVLDALVLMDPVDRPRVVLTGGGAGDPLPAEVVRRGLTDHVAITGWLSDEELDSLYRASRLVVLPTRFEGFGLPVLEAMARGVPVLCSDLGVLREVAGGAARYVDSTDPAAVARELLALLDDAGERERLRLAGAARATGFTWDRTTALTARSFIRAADRRRG